MNITCLSLFLRSEVLVPMAGASKEALAHILSVTGQEICEYQV